MSFADNDYLLLRHEVDGVFPGLLNVVRYVWCNESFPVDREFVIESLSCCTSVHYLQHSINRWLSKRASISVHVIEAESSFDLLSPSNSLCNVINGL